jgi:hypothetical protein
MKDWDLFGENEFGRPVDARGLFEFIEHMVEEHDLEPSLALDVLVDMIRPGNSENSHDVKPLWVGAMWALGFGEVCDNISGMYLNVMPWGVGFALYTEKDFSFKALSPQAQRGFIESMCIVLQTGEMNAHVDEHNHICITDDEGRVTTMPPEAIIRQFREEIETELGPDAPEPGKPNDPTRRWMP